MVSKKKTFQFIALKKLPLPSSSKTDKGIFDEGSSYLQPTFCFLNPILIVGRLTFVKFYLIFNNICIRAKCGKISFNKFPCVLKYIQFGAKLFVCFNALCSYPHVKVEIRDSSQISTTAPIFLLFNYFRQKYLEIASCSDSLLI